MLGMMLAGLVANANWFTHQTIAQTLPTLEPYFIVRAIGGGIVVVSAFLFAINIIMTIISKQQTILKVENNMEVQQHDMTSKRNLNIN